MGEKVKTIVREPAENLMDTTQTVDTLFNNFFDLWYDETKYISSSKRFENQHYKNIIALGVYVVPCIISKLKTTPAHLFEALTQITGENPVPEAHWGDITQMAEDWVRWWENKPHV